MRLALGGCGFGGWSGLGSPFSIRIGWTIFLSSFRLWLRSLLSLSTLLCVCHPYSFRSLRFCVCSPVCALSLSLCSSFSVRFFRCPPSQSCVLFRSVHCAEWAGPSSSSTYTDTLSLPPLPRYRALPLHLHLFPDRRATAYCTYVFSFGV